MIVHCPTPDCPGEIETDDPEAPWAPPSKEGRRHSLMSLVCPVCKSKNDFHKWRGDTSKTASPRAKVPETPADKRV